MDSPAKSILILGAGSDIGRAVARRFAREGWRIDLAARNFDQARRDIDDIATRSGQVPSALPFDALEMVSYASFIDGLPSLPDVVVSMIGLLGDQKRAASDPAHAIAVMRSNYEGPAVILGMFAERFAARGSGVIVGVSSVAGDRGRASNYVYGSAKAGFTAFLSGLRNAMARKNVHVVTVKPGFVRTRMTAGMKLPAALTAEPDEVAEAIHRAVLGRRDIVYVRSIWRLIMLVIRAIPEAIFKKLSL